ncbi:MAG TPA: S28 family serine protease [Bdellovibrionota bacterium]|nr:S28 family serine protease [Bdellovibrionota bacterium]
MKFGGVQLSALAFILAFGAAAPVRAADDVLAKLTALPGIADGKETTTEDDTKAGLRRFVLHVEQASDHFDASKGTFLQKLVLFHRDFTEPMVLQTSGYSIYSEKLSRTAKVFGTNQLQVEHRFFADSHPDPMDWTLLTVRQSAEDFHRIVDIFKALYAGHWVGTGASKGGMTSVFHRRFYPGDLDGTVADVAPMSFTREDPRYVTFVDQAGGAKYEECRGQLERLQEALLQRRDELEPLVDGTYTVLGGKDTSYEHSVIEMPFAFWQYGNPEDADLGCAKAPGPWAEVADLKKFLVGINDPSGYSDTDMAGFGPYYYQAAFELGGPASKLTHLADLLRHPYNLEMYLPQGVTVDYTDVTQRDVGEWVASEATHMMFTYGEFDPWSAGAYTRINAAEGSDNHWFQVPAGNHGSGFTLLPDGPQAEAVAALTRWLGKGPVPAARDADGLRDLAANSLEDAELRANRKHHRL